MQKPKPSSRRKSDHKHVPPAPSIQGSEPSLHDTFGYPPSRRPIDDAEQVPHGRPIIQSITGVVLQIDRNGTLLFLNEFGRTLFGCGDECIGAGIFGTVIDPDPSPSRPGVPAMSFSALRAFFNGEHKHRLRHGKEVWISWSSTGVRGESGGETGLLCTGIDVTEFRRFKDKASAYIDALAFLSHAGMYFVEHTSREDLFLFIGEHLHKLLKDDPVIVASCGKTADTVTITGLWAGRKQTEALRQLLGRSVTGMTFSLPPEVQSALQPGPIARLQGVRELPFRALPQPVCETLEKVFGPGSLHILPLATQNERLGVAAVLTPSRKTLQSQQLIEAFIAQASVALKRVSTEEEVVHAAEEWRTTFDSISDILFVTDRDARILRVNRACADLFGMKPGDMIGKSCDDIFPPDFLPSLASLGRQAFDGGTRLLHEFYAPRFQRHYELSLTPVFNERREPVKAINVVKEITERKKAEEILRRDRNVLQRIVQEKTEALLGTQRELENARRLSDIGVLAATIAHEIRNPLAAIKTAAYNIRRKSRNPDLDGHLANIDKKVMESDQIIRNLLSYSRIKLPNYEWVPVSGVLKDSMDALAEKYARREIALTHDLSSVTDTLIEADPVHLKVLFNNILDNACQALPDGKGSVHLAARSDERELTVAIRDTGIGIGAEDLKRLSEPFFTTKSRGIGLGLTICYQIASLHHGRIQVESEKGKGTTVTVTLPLSRSSS